MFLYYFYVMFLVLFGQFVNFNGTNVRIIFEITKFLLTIF